MFSDRPVTPAHFAAVLVIAAVGGFAIGVGLVRFGILEACQRLRTARG